MYKDEWGERIPETAADHLALAAEGLPFVDENGCRGIELGALRDAIEHVVQAINLLAPVVTHPRYNLCGDD